MTFRSKLIGAWELVSWTGTNKDDPDDTIYPMGDDCKGMILYTPDGYVSAHLNRAGTPIYTEGPFQSTAAQQARVASETLAYSGLYYLEEGDGDGPHRLYHHMKVSVLRNWVESVQGRPARIVEKGEETTLYLEGKAIEDSKGVLRLPKVKWKKMKDNSQGGLPSGYEKHVV